MVVLMIGTAKEILSLLAERHASGLAKAAPLVEEVRARLPAAVEILRSKFGAREVILFGSFARGTPLPRSDVDIAVRGVAPGEHFRAMAFLSDVLGHTVDLVRLEDLNPADREHILSDSVPA